MSPLKLEGDLNEISEQQQNFIIEILDDLGYKDKALVEVLGKAGDNFGASVKRITVEKDSGNPLKLIVKIAPQNPMFREMMSTTLLFQNEIIIYEQMFPKFSQIEKRFDIPEEQRFVYPAYYGAFKQVPHEVLLLDDMTEHGFKAKDKMVSLEIGIVKLVLKSFAQFHSLSYALKNENLEVYNKIKESLLSMWAEMSNKKDFLQMFEPMDEQVLSMLDSEIAKQKCKGLLVNLPRLQSSLGELEKDEKESVILQGDGWTNNFLFKTEEGQPTSCLMIDYQMSRVSNPAGDLLYMIFNCTDYETRKEHFNDWIDYYYSELEKALSNFGLRIQYELPKYKLQEGLKKHGKCATAQAVLVSLVTMREESESQTFRDDIKNKAMQEMIESFHVSNLKQKSLERIIGRVRGTVASAIEYGFI